MVGTRSGGQYGQSPVTTTTSATLVTFTSPAVTQAGPGSNLTLVTAPSDQAVTSGMPCGLYVARSEPVGRHGPLPPGPYNPWAGLQAQGAVDATLAAAQQEMRRLGTATQFRPVAVVCRALVGPFLSEAMGTQAHPRGSRPPPPPRRSKQWKSSWPSHGPRLSTFQGEGPSDDSDPDLPPPPSEEWLAQLSLQDHPPSSSPTIGYWHPYDALRPSVGGPVRDPAPEPVHDYYQPDYFPQAAGSGYHSTKLKQSVDRQSTVSLQEQCSSYLDIPPTRVRRASTSSSEEETRQPDWLSYLREKEERDRQERREERERDREERKEKEERDRQERREERERDREALEVRLALDRAMNESKRGSSTSLSQPKFNFPILQDGEPIDSFLNNFVSLAEGFSLSDTDKGLYLLSSVRGEAKRVLTDLSSTSFKEMSEELRKHFLLTAETYRQLFREASRKAGESCKSFLARISHALDNWKELSKLDSWRELFLMEKLLTSVPTDLRFRLIERKDTVVKEAVDFADEYIASRSTPRSNLGNNASNTRGSGFPGKPGTPKGGNSASKGSGTDNKTSAPQSPQESGIRCYLCGKLGHRVSGCRRRQEQMAQWPNSQGGNRWQPKHKPRSSASGATGVHAGSVPVLPLSIPENSGPAQTLKKKVKGSNSGTPG